MGSTRFPGKVMADLDGKPMIGHLLDELKKCRRVDKVIVAIPDRQGEAPKPVLEQYLSSYINWGDFHIVQGPENDVAGRFKIALGRFPCDYFIRVCADSPLITAKEIDDLAKQQGSWLAQAELPANTRFGQPQIVKTEVFLKALPFFDDYDREHVTTFFTRRLVVDTPEDLDYVRRWIEFSKLLS